MEIYPLPMLRDNYAWLLSDGNDAAIIDPSEAEPAFSVLAARNLTLRYILNTHHHHDHCGGNLALKAATGATIIGPAYDQDRIPGIDQAVDEGTGWTFGSAHAQVFFIPGHTKGHIAFYFAGAKALFCGDTLFSIGCGRLFEGTPAQMWQSLKKLRSLPGDTSVYCGHEYTEANCRFALHLDPDNVALRVYAEEVKEKRAGGQPSVPSLLETEKAANPFLRADDPALALRLNKAAADPVDIFAEIRARKDHF